MSGKPAARQGDMTQYGGSIVQGSAGVRIGAPTGVACSVCPGGVTSGHPVNPLLGWCERVPEADEVLPAPLPPYRVLTGLVDRFGRTQTFHREAAGEFSGEITGVTDGAGRHFRLVLTTQAQRAEEARQQAISGGTEPSAFPDTLPGYTEYGRDNGIRLSAVWLTHDPEYPENLPAAPLVRYGWTPRGELAVVYDRSGKQVRSFTYDDKYRGRMVAHRHTGRPEIRYRYDSDGRVTEQLNPAGLSYTYQYEKDHITITDSLDRREVLHTQGEAGLKRVSEESRRWLASCGLTVEQMQNQMDPVYTPARKIHLYHCDHRGLPLALISKEGTTEWCAEYDEWGNLLNEENPHQLQQLIRLPGQQYDEESGLYYNRHRYYDPLQGRYITQDPIGLKGGWNFYQYPLNPISNIDPLGLETLKCIKPLHSMGGTGERSGPDIWGNPFYHQYLCVPDGKGDYTCGGQDQRGESKGDGLWGPGKASNDTKEAAGRCDLVETDNSCVENCLKGKFKEVRPRYSVLPDIFTPINLGLFKNCQDWSNDSLETCKMKCSGNNIGRFIRFVFTGVM
ncbi:TPA: RHS repeat protein [Escherichia coli]|nr:RHS repeat protein [Escherichia coli]